MRSPAVRLPGAPATNEAAACGTHRGTQDKKSVNRMIGHHSLEDSTVNTGEEAVNMNQALC
jgi:hypothetical protein